MLTAVLSLSLLCADPQPAPADEPQTTPAKIREVITAVEECRDREIERITRELKEAGRVVSAKDKAKRKEAAAYLKELKLRREAVYIPLPMVSPTLTIGYFGTLSSGFELFQRIDDDETLVYIWGAQGSETLAMIRGSGFEGIADGQHVTSDRVYVVVGTYNYTTANGTSKTVKLLEPFREQAEYERAFAAWLAER